jgi:hypothetical protein
MTKSPISLQDLRRRIYVKAKAESTWRFWGLYVHVCKMETLQAAYQMAKSNHGAPGVDGITFDVIEESGVESFLKQIQDELVHNTYQPMTVRKKEIPKDGGNKVRVLSIPTIQSESGRSSTLKCQTDAYPLAIGLLHGSNLQRITFVPQTLEPFPKNKHGRKLRKMVGLQ